MPLTTVKMINIMLGVFHGNFRKQKPSPPSLGSLRVLLRELPFPVPPSGLRLPEPLTSPRGRSPRWGRGLEPAGGAVSPGLTASRTPAPSPLGHGGGSLPRCLSASRGDDGTRLMGFDENDDSAVPAPGLGCASPCHQPRWLYCSQMWGFLWSVPLLRCSAAPVTTSDPRACPRYPLGSRRAVAGAQEAGTWKQQPGAPTVKRAALRAPLSSCGGDPRPHPAADPSRLRELEPSSDASRLLGCVLSLRAAEQAGKGLRGKVGHPKPQPPRGEALLHPRPQDVIG